MQSFVIEFGFDEAARENGFDFGSKDKALFDKLKFVGHVCVVQRLDSNSITNQIQGTFFVVPKRKREHPVQSIETVSSPFGPGTQKNFRVRVGAELVTPGDELFAQ